MHIRFPFIVSFSLLFFDTILLLAQPGISKIEISSTTAREQRAEFAYDSAKVMEQRILQEEIVRFRFAAGDNCLPPKYAGFLFEQIFWRGDLQLFPLYFFKTKGLRQMKLIWKNVPGKKIIFGFDKEGNLTSFNEYTLQYHNGYITKALREKYDERDLETNKITTIYDTTSIYCKQDTLVLANESRLKVYKKIDNTYFKVIEYSNLERTWAYQLEKTEYSLKRNEDGTVCTRLAKYNGAWSCITDVMTLPISEYDIFPDGPELSLKVAQTALDTIEASYPQYGQKKVSFIFKNGFLSRICDVSKYNIVDTIMVENKYY